MKIPQSITGTIRRFIKPISAFFIINFLTSLVAPNIAHALTGGPTNPDYTSFEPVDSTDMVNLLSGDLAYNIPLLEVPGPAGGYPLSLSYHAGLMLNEEASWVGLGWTLNPGAINRSVNGFPDDHKNVETTDRFFWEGGTRKQYDIGVNLGVGDIAGVSAGISLGTDTYQGFGVGSFMGLNVGLLNFGKNDQFGLGVGINSSIDPWGNGHQSVGVSVGTEIEGLNFSSGANTNFQSFGFNGSVSVGGQSLLGASTSSDLKSVNTSIVGQTGIVNNKSGNVSTSSFGFALPIPFVYLGFKQNRYWIDETENIETNGALYYPNFEVDKTWLDTHSYDTYYSVDADELTQSGFPQLNGAKSLGGSFVNYDHYAVTGQGISGNIRPYKYQQHLLRQNVTADNEVTQFITGYNSDQSFTWRFINDFSNRMEYDPTNFEWGIPEQLPQLTQESFDFDGFESLGETGGSIISQSNGEESLINGLSGSRDIKTYTNKEITDGETGFIENNSTGFNRSNLPWDQIGAYVITNESGVSYHYTLPACSYDEYQYSENIEKGEGHTFNELNRPEEYTYTWHLTAITGPDFVDRGTLGELDEEDWGYWVDFEYGKWTDQYFWRNPGEGMDMDLDNDFQNFAEGTKELYYLDAIKTKTHTALFVKDVREDALSALKIEKNFKHKLPQNSYNNEIIRVNKDESFDGGFQSKMVTTDYTVEYYTVHDDCTDQPKTISLKKSVSYQANPTKSLRLKKILLLNNSDENSSKNLGNWSFSPASYQWTGGYSVCDDDREVEIGAIFSGLEDLVFNQHLADNILDTKDIEGTILESKALRVIDFNNDHYDLVPGTPNSSSGKLTLKSLQFLGKGGVSIIPPMKFEYDLEDAGYLTTYNNTNDISSLSSYGNLEDNDLVEVERISDGTKAYFLYKNYDFGILFKKIGGNNISSNTSVRVKKTKNAPYAKDYYDNWGMYKSDFRESLCEINEAIGRQVTDVSAQNVDVWSLRNIKTSLGAEIDIEYESDSFDDIELFNSMALGIYDIVHQGSNEFKITLTDEVNEFDLSDYYYVDEKISLNSIFGMDISQLPDYDIEGENENNYKPERYCFQHFPHMAVRYIANAEDCLVKSIGNNFVVITSEDLKNRLIGDKTVKEKSYLRYKGDCSASDKVRNVSYYSNEFPDHFYGGFLSFDNEKRIGGGLRISGLSIKSDLITLMTKYQYEDGNTSYLPFGLIPPKVGRTALVNSQLQLKFIKENSYYMYSDIFKNSREIPPPGVLYGKVTTQGYVNEEKVPNYETYEFETFKAGMVDYNIEWDEDQDVTQKGWEYNTTQYKRQKTRRVSKKDFTSRVGQLKRMTVYSQNDQKLSETINHFLHDDLVYPTDPSDREYFDVNQNTYTSLVASKFNNQGVIEETFADGRMIKDVDQFEMLGIVSKHEHYPSIMTGSTTKNYKTGISTTSRNLGFDFYSGQVSKMYNEDGYGNKYVSKSVPAYRFYPDMANKNMLIQEGASYSYLMNNSFDPQSYVYNQPIKGNSIGLVASSAQSWNSQLPFVNGNGYNENEGYSSSLLRQSNTIFLLDVVDGSVVLPSKAFFRYENEIVELEVLGWSGSRYYVNPIDLDVNIGTNLSGAVTFTKPIWRKHESFSYISKDSDNILSDGIVDKLSFEELPLGVAISESDGWQKNSEITLYDINSHALEAMDINENYAATKFDSNNERVVATVANARYDEFYYFGFNGNVIEDVKHTGMGAEEITNAEDYQDEFVVPDGSYRASIWVNSSNIENFAVNLVVNGNQHPGIISEDRKAGDWYLVEWNFVKSTGEYIELEAANSVATSAYLDDLRIHPIDATMTSYAYNEWGELSDILDANNLFTHYKYDPMGRLKSVTRETFSHGAVKTSESVIFYGNNN